MKLFSFAISDEGQVQVAGNIEVGEAIHLLIDIQQIAMSQKKEEPDVSNYTEGDNGPSQEGSGRLRKKKG